VDTFVAKVTPTNGDPIVAVFDVQGLARIVSKYTDQLNW